MFKHAAFALLLVVTALPWTSSARAQAPAAGAQTPAAESQTPSAQTQDPSADTQTRTIVAEPVEPAETAPEADADVEPPIVQTEVIDIAGKWTFNMYGSVWAVDLVREPTKNPNDPKEAIYCGQAARERRDPDTPIITRRLCAGVQDFTLYASIPGTACKATWREMMQIDGRCGGGGMGGGMDGGASGGVFQATRLSKGGKK